MHLLINIPDRTGVSVNSEAKHFVKYNLVFLRWAAKSPTQLVTTTSLLQLLQAVPFQLPIMQEYLERNKNNVTMNMRVYEINDNDLHLSCVVLTAPYTPGHIPGTHLLLELLHCSNPDQLLLTWWSYNCHNLTWHLEAEKSVVVDTPVTK